MKRSACLAFLVISVALIAMSCDQSGTQMVTPPRKFVFIHNGESDGFWQAVQAGAIKAGQDYKVEVLWQGPTTKDNDRQEQIKAFEDAVAQKVNGIIVAPLDDSSLGPAVASAAENGIPVATIGSELKSEDVTCFVGIDDLKGGALAAEELARLLDGKGKVALLHDPAGPPPAQKYAGGFEDAIHQQKDIELVAMSRPDLSHPVDGVFCTSEALTRDMLRALQESKLAGKTRLLGCGLSADLVDALTAGQINALVASDPNELGYTAVKTLAWSLRGEQAPKQVSCGVKLLTKPEQ